MFRIIKKTVFLITIIVISANVFTANAVNYSMVVPDVKIFDNDNNPALLKNLGKNTLLIFYTDPDKQNINRPIRNYLNKNRSMLKNTDVITIANCNVSWIPYEIVKQRYTKMAKKNIGKFYYDEYRRLGNRWRLPNGNNAGFVIIVGKDKKIKFIKKIRLKRESRAIITKISNVIREDNSN